MVPLHAVMSDTYAASASAYFRFSNSKSVPTAFSSFRQRYRFATTLDALMIVPIVIRGLPCLPNNGAQRRCCLCRLYGASCTVSTEIHLLLGAMIAFDHARARTLWLA